jgi:NAD(P)-dependent dehydrogenase (short-subunit alcohol dehydrogenase family)
MELNLNGKVALVTGASRGIGLEIADAYARAGARVMLTSRKADDLAASAATIDGEVAWTVANAGDEAAAARAVSTTLERFGAVDILVNNAATNPYFGPMIDISATQMTKTVDVNLRAMVSWSQLVWQAYMREAGGTILNIASIGAFTVEPNIGFYNATKAGVVHVTKQFAVELGPRVRVLGIAPGIVKTAMAEALWRDREQELAKRMPRGRLGEPSDIAAVAVFLASDASSWMTGTTITVDGGGHLVGF